MNYNGSSKNTSPSTLSKKRFNKSEVLHTNGISLGYLVQFWIKGVWLYYL